MFPGFSKIFHRHNFTENISIIFVIIGDDNSRRHIKIISPKNLRIVIDVADVLKLVSCHMFFKITKIKGASQIPTDNVWVKNFHLSYKIIQKVVCKNNAMLQLVGYQHSMRSHNSNLDNLSLARCLLRLTWSLSYSTISDFINSIETSDGSYDIKETSLFYQCAHNHHLLDQIGSNIREGMARSAENHLLLRTQPGY